MNYALSYLARLGIEDSGLAVTPENLALLQRRHLLNIPFENLDIHWKNPIVLDVERFREKILTGKRGGFCYELNGLFADLLNTLGFESELISARVTGENSEPGPEYDHLTILTRIGDTRYLVDAGFGSFISAPLRFVTDIEQQDASGIYLIRKYDTDYFEVVKKEGDRWLSECLFKDLPRELPEFAGMCEFHQTSPESHFTHGRICSLMTENGRKTLTDKNFIVTENGVVNKTEIESEEEFYQLLEREFGIGRSGHN